MGARRSRTLGCHDLVQSAKKAAVIEKKGSEGRLERVEGELRRLGPPIWPLMHRLSGWGRGGEAKFNRLSQSAAPFPFSAAPGRHNPGHQVSLHLRRLILPQEPLLGHSPMQVQDQGNYLLHLCLGQGIAGKLGLVEPL